MFRLAISFCLIAASLSDSLQPGPCPEITVDPINLDKVAGVWLEHKRSLNNWGNLEKCAKAIWHVPHNGIAKMAGKWYGYARSSNNRDEAERCPIFNWIQIDDGRTLFVFSDISALINDNSTIVAD
ncbi:Protein of unknown function, partial [Cotesia congregata]